MKEHSGPPFVPENHPMASLSPSPSGCGQGVRSSTIPWDYWGALLGRYPNEGATWAAVKCFPCSQSWVVPTAQCLTPSHLWQEVTPRCPCPQAPLAASPSGFMPQQGANLRALWFVDAGICPSRAGSLGTFACLSKCGNFCPSSLLGECQD